jgi:hypothetical protein
VRCVRISRAVFSPAARAARPPLLRPPVATAPTSGSAPIQWVGNAVTYLIRKPLSYMAGARGPGRHASPFQAPTWMMGDPMAWETSTSSSAPRWARSGPIQDARQQLDQAELLLRAFKARYLQRGSWTSRSELIAHLDASWPEYNRLYAHPFTWSWTRAKMHQWVDRHGPDYVERFRGQSTT